MLYGQSAYVNPAHADLERRGFHCSKMTAMAVQHPQVVVVGSCNIDLISYTPRLPKAGETIHGTNFEQGFGGKGANQCVMAARLGARCAMVAKLGDDQFGLSTINNFKTNNVNVDHVTITSHAPSGVAAITVNDQGENCIVIVSGANMSLSSDDVYRAESLIANARVLVCQLEVTPETTLTALKLARKHGVKTIFNTAPGVSGLDLGYYKNTDILCLNESEAETLVGVSVTDLAAGYKAVDALQSLDPGCVVLTLGDKGVMFSERQDNGLWTDTQHIPAEQVEPVDTTGAGDAFVGALAYYLACGEDKTLAQVLNMSGVIASYTVLGRGTQSSYCIDSLPKHLFV